MRLGLYRELWQHTEWACDAIIEKVHELALKDE